MRADQILMRMLTFLSCFLPMLLVFLTINPYDISMRDDPWAKKQTDVSSEATTGHPSDLVKEGNETQDDAEQEITTSEAINTQEKDLAESDIVAGSSPASGTQSDVGEMTKQVGFNYDKDNGGDGYENDEVNIAKQIDDAEEGHIQS